MLPENLEVRSSQGEVIPPFLPVRMLNEFTYCARLGYLEWVQGEFTDNDDTVEGRYHHRNPIEPDSGADGTRTATAKSRRSTNARCGSDRKRWA